MSCPNCNASMEEKKVDNQKVLHCPNCGGSFFEENGINRLSAIAAEKLANDKQTDEVSGSDKKCPKDQTILKAISNEENIPADVTLLRCSACRGVFAYPDDLLKFKQAQEAKINYFKLWNIPLPTLKAVLVLSFTAAVALSFFSSIVYFQKQRLGPTQATDVAKTIKLNRSGPYLFISFRTATPLYSQVVFRNNSTNEVSTKTISDKPTLLHYFTTNNLSLNDEIYYQIILTDEKGHQVKTEEKRLILP